MDAILINFLCVISLIAIYKIIKKNDKEQNNKK